MGEKMIIVNMAIMMKDTNKINDSIICDSIICDLIICDLIICDSIKGFFINSLNKLIKNNS